MYTPFRWNLAKREQLGMLVQGLPAESYPRFEADLAHCCVRLLSLSDNADLLFLGRSPESIFDYLSGLLLPTSWTDRCLLCNLSLRSATVPQIQQDYPGALSAIRQYLTLSGLAPQQIVARPRPVALIDLVSTGTTFGQFVDLLLHWTREQRVDEQAMKRKLRFIGITWRTHTSPKTWRWQQHVSWAKLFRPGSIKNVAIPGRLWDYLGNRQPKVAQWNPPGRWGTKALAQPVHTPEHLAALRLALHLYEKGQTPAARLEFTKQLVQQPGMSAPWFRSLVGELRGTAQPESGTDR